MIMSSSSALPLKVTAAPTSAKHSPTSEGGGRTPTKQLTLTNPGEISSPHELTAFVESLLEQLDSNFDEMSSQILDRMSQMSNRVDALENAIQDIISGDVTTPSASPTQYPQTPVPRRSGNGVS